MAEDKLRTYRAKRDFARTSEPSGGAPLGGGDGRGSSSSATGPGVCTALDHLGVAAGAKVSGRRGIHILIPVGPDCPFARPEAWVEQLSRTVGAVVPDLVSWQWRKDERRGLARLDYTQNARNRTMVAPWSPRFAPGLPVSVPLTWDELDDPDLQPDRWTIATVTDRLDRPDPLAHLLGRPQPLPALDDTASA